MVPSKQKKIVEKKLSGIKSFNIMLKYSLKDM